MSTDPDKDTACPKVDTLVTGTRLNEGGTRQETSEKKRKKPSRSVRFPDEDQLVTKYFEPSNPWHDVPYTTRAQLAAEYLEECRRHSTTPIDSVLQQIRELPENSIGGGNRAARLTLAECSLAGAAPVDALEAVLRKVQFRRFEIQYCEVDDEGAEAMFDMIEYYESANAVSISGPRQFGIRGWQAACRMIKKSAELSELSLCESALCASHAPVLVRALRPHACRLRSLCLQRAELRGEPLLCLVIALKSNTSIRELRLPDNQLSVSDAQQLASLLKLNLHIQLLDLSNNDIQDAGTGYIADALVEQAAQTPPSAATSPLSPLHCPPNLSETRLGLAFLVLWNNQLTRNCAPHLTKALRSSQSLCVLNIGRNALGADTVRALRCGSLVSLGLQSARLGPGAAHPLSDLLRPDTRLQRLDLRDNRLGVVGLQAILNAMQDNTTITQIDLDDPVESSTLSAEESEAATIARLTRDIAALCRRNEPPASEPERRVHRKISLTCHTAFPVKPAPRCPEAGRTRTARLRSPAPSPAPSPAGSPVPHAPSSSNFNVSRMTPERESSGGSSPVPSRPPYSPLTPSRFKVVQVAEPPQIQIHPATQKRPTSRFSVTRNYDAMYNPSPPRASPTPSLGSPSPSAGTPSPSVSPVPSVLSITSFPTGSPTASMGLASVVTSSSSAIAGSSIVATDSSTMSALASVTTGASTLATGTPTVITRSPTVMTTSAAVITGSSTVMAGSATVVIGSPVVTTGASTLATGSPPVIVGSPTVMAGSATVVTGSPTVTTGSRAEMTSSLTMSTGSPTVITTVLTGPSTVMTGSPSVMTVSATITTGPHTVIRDPSVVTVSTDLHTITTSPCVSMSGSDESKSSTAVSNVSPLKTISKTHDTIDPRATGESLSSGLVTGSDTVGVQTIAPVTDMLANVTKPPNLSPNVSPILAGSTLAHCSISVPISIDTTISTDDVVTSAVKASMSPSLTAVPNASIMSHFENLPHGNRTESDIVNKNTGAVEALQENSNKISDSVIPIGDTINASKCSVPETNIHGEANDQPVQLSPARIKDLIIDYLSDTRMYTIKETDLNKTSLDTATGFIGKTRFENVTYGDIESFKADMERIKSLNKLRDIETSLEDRGNMTEDDRFQSRFAITVIPKNVLEAKAVPNTRFSISPTPENFSTTHESIDKVPKLSESDTCGTQSQIAAAKNKPFKMMEADILTVLAEMTEKVEPKVFEPKSPHATDLNKQKSEVKSELLIETKENKIAMDQENTPIDVSSDTSLIDKTIDIRKPLTEISKTLMPEESFSRSRAEDEGFCFDIMTIPTDTNYKGDVSPKEPVKLEHVRVDLKSILKSEAKSDTQQELPKTKTLDSVAEFNDTSKLEDKNTSDKIGELKTESVKNKTYSEVVKSDPKYVDKSEQLSHKEEISDNVVKTEIKLVKDSVEMCDFEKLDVKVEVTVKKESVQDAKVHVDQNKDFVNIDDIIIKEPRSIKNIEAITEDLGNLLQEMKDLSSKSRKVKSDCTVDIVSIETNTVPGNFNRDIVLKKNKSESSLDSPDLEVSRLMNKKLVGSPFCDSSSSLEVSGSSMESLNATENQHVTCHLIPKQVVIQESVESDTELDRRKDVAISMGSSIESTSDVTPVNSGNFLNMSVSSNESVSPIIFGKKKKIHDSLSSLEASMSSLDSGRQEKIMVTSADSGIEYSLQQPSESKEDNSSNEGTLTHNSSLKETVKKAEQETLTSSPKRASSLLDVPALKTKGLDRMRKISWVAPSSSFHIPRPAEPEKVEKPSHLEKLLSLFQHPTSLFSRSQSDEERKSTSNTPPRKDSSLTSSFWSWGSTIEKDDKDDSSEATDSTLSERVQVSFVDESFSKKLDSKTPSTDTDNTLSEFQSFPTQPSAEKVTDTTDEDLVQKCLDLSLIDKAGSNGNSQRACDTTDLSKPNDLNKNYDISNLDEVKSEYKVVIENDEVKVEAIRPRSFAAVLKSSGSENSLDKQPSPETGHPVDKLPSKVIRGIKENISPENTLTSNMTKTLALELTERQVKNQQIVNTVWEVPLLDKSELKTDEVKAHSDLAPIATIDETSDEAADNTVNVKLEFIDDFKTDLDEIDINKEVITKRKTELRTDVIKEELILEEDKEEVTTSITGTKSKDKLIATTELENVDLGKDALSYLTYESQDFEVDTEHAITTKKESSLAQELKEAEIKEMLDLSPELIIDEAIEPEVFTKAIKGMKLSPVIPERAKLKKSNSLEDLSQREESAKSSPKTKTIAFKIPETQPRDIPRTKLRTMSGSSPKSLPESLNKPCPLTKLESTTKKRKKVSSLGKMAKDSLLALNMSEDEIAEHRRSYATSAESLRSLESVSENSQSGTSVDSRCRSCLRTSQESLMSLDSITEDCKCGSDCEKGRPVR